MIGILNLFALVCFVFLAWRYQKWSYNKHYWPRQERMLERRAKRELEVVLKKRNII